jgi:hypothetical protein
MSAASAENILQNGDFEADPEGTAVNVTGGGEVDVISGWRFFAVNGATGSATVTEAAGRSGKGLEMVRQAAGGSDSALDKDDAAVVEDILVTERIYKMTIDARDGGTYGGTTWLSAELQFPGTSGLNRGKIFDPAADWETFGLTARSGLEGKLSTRFNMLSEVNASVYLDNATVVDATVGVNRVVNGGFENSSTRALNWRFFDQFSPSGSVALSSNAYSGSSAILLSVTSPADGDIGLDLEGNRIATIGGESLTLSFAAMNADISNEVSRLQYTVAGFDSAGAFTSNILQDVVAPPADQYGTFSVNIDVPENVTELNVAFRSFDDFFFEPTVGSYLIDDVLVSRQMDVSGADFNSDGRVDGRDFLMWQRGDSPNSLSASDLALWQEAFGQEVPALMAVPEPASLALCASVLLLAGFRRRSA